VGKSIKIIIITYVLFLFAYLCNKSRYVRNTNTTGLNPCSYLVEGDLSKCERTESDPHLNLSLQVT